MQNPFGKQTAKLKRASKLTSILSKYGFEDLQAKVLSSTKRSKNQDAPTPNQDFYQRIRRALEEAGPTFIKFGQTLSTREDLFPKELITEFKKLQDDVAPEPLDINKVLIEELGIEPSAYFLDIDPIPMASASIAQVYKAKLVNGNNVILKIKRSNIQEIVYADLELLRDLITLLTNYYNLVKEINLIYVFEAFAVSLQEELSFNNELNNIEHFRRNFAEDHTVQLMKPYRQLSNNNIICISFIEGVKINDIEGLKRYNLDIEKTLDQLLNLFLKQILEHGFFHADPHPGNILVTPQGKISFIDMGAMAKVLPKDRERLEDFIIYFIHKDSNRLVSTIKKMAIQIDIENEKVLERAIDELMHIIDNQNLEDIDIKALFTRFSHILNQNNIIMPDHVYLLVKGIVLMEGIGRELNPQINVVEKVKPYIKKITAKQISIDKLWEHGLSTLWEIRRFIKTGPQTLSKIGDRLSDGEFQIQAESKAFNQFRLDQLRNNSLNRFLTIICTTFIGACLLANINQTQFWGISIISWILFALSALLLLQLLIKRSKLPQ
ncbi:ABC1 kinase family protein [Sphingobacterium rhinopitheci]|uniref:ABC1 kinase family protein n=1 Tax=Sphingobacterium rhinopitheci TaxID=2781960 RepID=UPI001F5175FB|nr:AarF/UbiB family protein [Sphingobacterium rhinopitheci]MCI0921783.1 AarF/ABC1/UbiB kinase family protein [Sphingobacterium rhinopitheci]